MFLKATYNPSQSVYYVLRGSGNLNVIHYGTFFFTNIVSVTVFTACLCLLAWNNRKVTGMQWFAGGMVVGLVKLVLQGLEGNIPPVLGDMVTNELYLVSFVMQLLGLRWFVLRKPIRHWWPFIAIGIALVTYTVLFLDKVPIHQQCHQPSQYSGLHRSRVDPAEARARPVCRCIAGHGGDPQRGCGHHGIPRIADQSVLQAG